MDDCIGEQSETIVLHHANTYKSRQRKPHVQRLE